MRFSSFRAANPSACLDLRSQFWLLLEDLGVVMAQLIKVPERPRIPRLQVNSPEERVGSF